MVDTIVHHVEAIISQVAQKSLQATQPEVIKDGSRSRVIRYTTAHHTIPSVIVKTIEQDESCGFSEWASLQFLSTIDNLAGSQPYFYGGHKEARLVVMQDLGRAANLGELFDDGHRPTILAALSHMAQHMAHLVGHTRGQEALFEKMRAQLPGYQTVGRHVEAQRWCDGRIKLGHWFEALRVPTPPGFDRVFYHIATVYMQPGPWLSFSHGDPAPTNNHISTAGVRLLDFEYGAFRHALYDLTAWNILCPLPEAWIQLMMNCFQQQVIPWLPEGGNEKTFQEAWALICAYRALALITWLPLTILTVDRPWVGRWTMREAFMSTCIRLHNAVADVPSLAALTQLSQNLIGAARDRWPEVGDGTLKWGAGTLEEGIENAKSRLNFSDYGRDHTVSRQNGC
ncbi:MAG: hypothetical protein KDJ65_10635 [Anaerolineae bacterium]|nr:hypothetical protein [Anaerolineae bacterium]